MPSVKQWRQISIGHMVPSYKDMYRIKKLNTQTLTRKFRHVRQKLVSGIVSTIMVRPAIIRIHILVSGMFETLVHDRICSVQDFGFVHIAVVGILQRR